VSARAGGRACLPKYGEIWQKKNDAAMKAVMMKFTFIGVLGAGGGHWSERRAPKVSNRQGPQRCLSGAADPSSHATAPVTAPVPVEREHQRETEAHERQLNLRHLVNGQLLLALLGWLFVLALPVILDHCTASTERSTTLAVHR